VLAEESDLATIYQRPVELLQRLVRFDTTNPPGNERACVEFIRDVLAAQGIASDLLARNPERPNLIARLPGRGEAPPLLLQGHVDVVPVAGQQWTHPPFAAEIADGCVWGCGTLDMKGGVAMMLAAILRAKAEGLTPAGDIIFCALADEENGGADGAEFLTTRHAERFAGVRYALGEFGAFTLYVGRQRCYPIMMAEKQAVAARATIRGQGGHAAFPLHGEATAKLARFLQRLDQRRLPVHITPVPRQMIKTLAGILPPTQGMLLRRLLNPPLTNRVLKLLGPFGSNFENVLHNTAVPTVIRGGAKNNVIPSEITVELDCRVLPGFTTEHLLAELHALAGDEVEFEVLSAHLTPLATPDMGLFETLAGIIKAADPEGTPLPYMLGAVTDGYFFAQLGIQCYGFLPMRLPQGWNLPTMAHAADERIPVEAMAFGANAMFEVLRRYSAPTSAGQWNRLPASATAHRHANGSRE
jgi:acetylornithine deacetylase/succinyl-diaminopimelate desuccinylase-like protein